jgi:hypothetical protein
MGNRDNEPVKSLLRPLVTVIALSLAALSLNLHADRYYYIDVNSIDFDIHYYGAQVERVSTYTDTERVRQFQEQQRKIAQPEGVVGTPTLIALVYFPFSHLPVKTAEHLWKMLAAGMSVLALMKAMPRKWWPYIPAAFCTGPMLLGIYVGNVSILTFALVAYAYGALKSQQNRAAGIVLGLAAALKGFPIILIVALIAHRNWTAVRWMIGTAATATALGIAVLGPHDFALAVRHMLQYTPFGSIVYTDNLSVPGLLYEYLEIPILSAITALVLLLAGSAYFFWRPLSNAAFTLAAMSGVMLLGNGLSWSHYFGLAFLCIIALLEMPSTRSVQLRTLLCAALLVVSIGESKITFVATAILMTDLVMSTWRPRTNPIPSPSN